MKKTLLIMLLSVIVPGALAQVVIPRQEIPYRVNYKWGLIDVNIARGLVAVESDGSNFYGTLDGTSIPWEGKIICVSDTLQANMVPVNDRYSEKVQYQTGWYRHPSLSTYRSENYNPNDPAIFRNIAGEGDYSASGDSMEAVTVTSDMIGMYYFAKALDFEALQPGTVIEIPIEGPYSRMVYITYQGKGLQNINGVTYPTYDCTFEYDYGGRMSGYQVDCRIGANDRVPVYLSASLPVGHVEMIYDPV